LPAQRLGSGCLASFPGGNSTHLIIAPYLGAPPYPPSCRRALTSRLGCPRAGPKRPLLPGRRSRAGLTARDSNPTTKAKQLAFFFQNKKALAFAKAFLFRKR